MKGGRKKVGREWKEEGRVGGSNGGKRGGSRED